MLRIKKDGGSELCQNDQKGAFLEDLRLARWEGSLARASSLLPGPETENPLKGVDTRI